MSNNSGSNDGSFTCSCPGLIIVFLLFWTLWVGLPTPWGKFNLDIFPPRLWEMTEPVEVSPVHKTQAAPVNSNVEAQ